MTRLEDLSPEQQAVVRSWGKSLAIMAGAGTGKTTTLVIKCEELIKRMPLARFAAVSFTEKSTSDLRDKLSERLPLRGEAGPLSSHWVMTIHGLCNSVLREFPREAGFDGEESMLSEPESQALWDQAVEGLWFDDLKGELKHSLDRLLNRESRDGLADLLKRTRELKGFGAMEFLSRSEDPDTMALSKIAQYALDRYERLKKRRGALDFNDLELGADRALEHESIRQVYHAKFDLVMVDEFQDTNPLQARIIQRFCKPDGSNLCVVGDPKQSIYRFRDADLSVFDEFCSKMKERHSLTWNFRSRPGIINYTNSLCSKAFASAEHLQPLVYEALVPKREAAPALDPVVRLDVSDPKDLAKWIHQQVQQGLELQDVALLLRKIRGNEKWLKALTSSGIPIAVGSGGLFWEDPRVRELASFLIWWDNPANTLSGAVFLRAPWMQIEDATLDLWKANWREAFFESQHPIALRLAPLRGQVIRPGELILQLLINQEVEDELGAPLLGLWHRLEELSSRGMGFHAAVSEIMESMQKSRRERDVPPPRNRGLLSVMTLHSSKGLEFPHVILVDLGKKPKSPDMPLLFWDRKDGTYLAGRDADRERQAKDPVESNWRRLEKEKSLAESKRLFYVALTRARERLILVCPQLEVKTSVLKPGKKPDVDGKAPDVFLEDDWRAWVENSGMDITRTPLSSSVHLDALKPESVSRSRAMFSDPIELKRPRHSVTEWNLLSHCPRAYEWTYIRPKSVTTKSDLVEAKPSGAMTQREMGTRVHACLEQGDMDGLDLLEKEAGSDRFQASALKKWASESPLMRLPIPGEDRVVWSELSFEVPVGEEILVGSMDRVVKAGDAYTVVDFKVTQRERSEASLIDSYQTQLELYSYALKKLSGSHSIECQLVHITPIAVHSVKVPTGLLDIESLVKHAAKIVTGERGRPNAGATCRYCEFKSICPEAQT